MSTERIAIFDIDGTLHKTEVMSLAAYKIVMSEYGLPMPTREKLFSTYGANTNEILTAVGVIGDEQYRAGFARRIDDEENKQLEVVGECYDGVLDSIKRLYDDGIGIGVCSMCSPTYMQKFLTHFGLNSIVKYRRNESYGTEKTLILRGMLDEYKPQKAVMIGDRIFDFMAAHNCGLSFVGCLYGYMPAELVGSDVLVKTGFEIYDAVKGLLM